MMQRFAAEDRASDLGATPQPSESFIATVKARLVAMANDWPWSSARFRDEFARLRLPPAQRPARGL